MSDLSSLPPLTWTPDDLMPRPASRAVAPSFAWPMPPYAIYPTQAPGDDPEPCEVEGINRKTITGRLVALDLENKTATVSVPPTRTAMTLRFGQFRRLTLTTPIAPVISPAAVAGDSLIECPGEADLTLRLVGDPAEAVIPTIGHVKHDAGLFYFPPVDKHGTVQRVFVPVGAIDRADLPGAPAALKVDKPKPRSEPKPAAATLQQKVEDVFAAQRVVSPEQLAAALQAQASMPPVRIGEALIALGYIVPSQLDEALEQQKADRSVPLGELLVRSGHVTPTNLRTALARKMGYPVVDISVFPVDRLLLAKLQLHVAQRLKAVPLMMVGARAIVAMEDPTRGDALDEVEFHLQCKAVPVLALADDFSRALHGVYQSVQADGAGATGAISAHGLPQEIAGADALLAQLEQQSGGRDEQREEQVIEQSDNSLVRLINAMIVEAHTQGASDIHVECPAGREKVRIRFRRDGAMKPYLELPHTYRGAMLARIKIMCDLDISERRRPQDGKINFERFVPGLKLELRVATIPTNNGNEDAVLRLLASAKPIPLDKLNLSPWNFRQLTQAIERPYGMVLCVGPTGSGKTTTLHSALARINTPERKIWTAEDPVEITQAGLRQVQVNPKIDWTFAKALRAFLRADPDVVMVGEIRDGETAGMAVEASLTGHLVLSTLHTNSAPETVTRLLDMGLDPFNFADSLLAVLAQRLLRRLCSKCVTSKPATREQVDELIADYQHAFGESENKPSADTLRTDWLARFGRDGQLMHAHAPGCEHCDSTGFRGRVGIHELLVVDRELRRMIQTGARVEELQRCALGTGMRTLRQDGIEKVLAGLTTIEEVRATSNS